MPPRSPWRRLAVAVGALALLVAVAAAPSAAAFGGSGRWLTYADGRVFIPHGLNLVVTKPPYYAAWFGVDDARLLAEEGFTAMRLNFVPSALEPQVGGYDSAYLDQFVHGAALLGRYGIATLPTLNQDGFSERCGVDGFPAWMELAPCATVWAPFWADAPAVDGAGLQAHYLAWWRYAFTRFAGSATLLGYDLLNEPVAPDEAILGDFWQRTVGALEPNARGRLLFAEPGAPGGTAFAGVLDRGTGYTSHVYCWTTLRRAFAGAHPTAAQVAGCIRADAALLRQQLSFAARNGYPLLIGEFGASDELREQSALVSAMGESFVPWLAYSYNARLDASGTATQSILRNESRPASEANAKQKKLDALVVPYPLATAGTPTSWRFDRTRRTVRFRYSTTPVKALKGKPTTVVFVPRRVYPTGYRVTVSGARVVSSPTAPWLQLATTPGARSVTVTIGPAVGSTTLTPLQVNRCGYDLRPCG